MKRIITNVRVERLFGRYDYDLTFGSDSETNLNRITLLYGDNGTGKTTILALIYHILSTSLSHGHNTYVAKLPFERFCIQFSDGSVIETRKPKGELIGSFVMSMIPREGKKKTAQLEFDPETEGIGVKSLTPTFFEILNLMNAWRLNVFYLRDSRDLQSDAISLMDESAGATSFSWHFREQVAASVDRPYSEQLDATLNDSIARARQWLRDETISASSAGETDARDSYVEILTTAATADVPR